METPSSRSALLALFAAMMSIQLGASLAKQMFTIVGPVGATMLRLFFAAVLLLAFWRPFNVRLERQALMYVVAYGASLGSMNALFYLSIERIPLGIAVALEFVGPLFVALFGSKKKIDVLWAALAALGIYLIVPDITSIQSLDPIGVLLALGAGACWASYIVFGKKTTAHLSDGHAVSIGMTVAALVVMPVALYFAGTKLFTFNVYPIALGVAVLSSALPYSLELLSLRIMPLKTFGILMSLEPVFAIFFGLMVLGEVLTGLQWAAVACIVFASAGSHLRDS